MNKTQLVDALAARLGDRRTASSAVDGLLEIIIDTVGSGSSVTLTGFGVFEPRARAARVARNPRTGETVPVPATTVPAFRPGTAFKATVQANGAGTGKPAPVRRTGGAAAGTATTARRRRATTAAASDAAPTPAVTEAPAKPGRRAARTSGSLTAQAEAPAEKPAKKPAKKAEPKKAAAKVKETKETKAAAQPAKKTPAKGKAKK
ncbi:HU family DNA-binding protein [Pseudonocardia sp.]|uniref:HU family DNA-binding protein n=1 Tax=Pseudonocardia sp. TaxID=60912 RepID=UPI0031FE26C1